MLFFFAILFLLPSVYRWLSQRLSLALCKVQSLCGSLGKTDTPLGLRLRKLIIKQHTLQPQNATQPAAKVFGEVNITKGYLNSL